MLSRHPPRLLLSLMTTAAGRRSRFWKFRLIIGFVTANAHIVKCAFGVYFIAIAIDKSLTGNLSFIIAFALVTRRAFPKLRDAFITAGVMATGAGCAHLCGVLKIIVIAFIRVDFDIGWIEKIDMPFAPIASLIHRIAVCEIDHALRIGAIIEQDERTRGLRCRGWRRF